MFLTACVCGCVCVNVCVRVRVCHRSPFSVGSACRYLVAHRDVVHAHSRSKWRRVMLAAPNVGNVEASLDWLLGPGDGAVEGPPDEPEVEE